MTTYLTIRSAHGDQPPRRVNFDDIARLFREGEDDAPPPSDPTDGLARLTAMLRALTAPLRETMRLLREEALARRQTSRATTMFSAESYF